VTRPGSTFRTQQRRGFLRSVVFQIEIKKRLLRRPQQTWSQKRRPKNRSPVSSQPTALAARKAADTWRRERSEPGRQARVASFVPTFAELMTGQLRDQLGDPLPRQNVCAVQIDHEGRQAQPVLGRLLGPRRRRCPGHRGTAGTAFGLPLMFHSATGNQPRSTTETGESDAEEASKG